MKAAPTLVIDSSDHADCSSPVGSCNVMEVTAMKPQISALLWWSVVEKHAPSSVTEMALG